eukprot:sb/3467948/
METGRSLPPSPAIVMCGDTISLPKDKNLKVGPGLRYINDQISCTKPGVIRSTGKSVWIDRNSRRYVPALEERVIGIIAGRMADEYRVDIGGAHYAMMSSIAFEGATQRNKPDLKIGSLVYGKVVADTPPSHCQIGSLVYGIARPSPLTHVPLRLIGSLVYGKVVAANKDVEPELSCVHKNGKSNGLQVLEGGYLINCSLGLCRKLLRHERPLPLLEPLFAHFKLFEICVGINGRVWINSDNVKHTLCISLYLNKCEYLPETELMPLLKDLVKRVETSM